ncbi:hypothetical protein [Polynucleobacter sp. AP-Latsch-80-C2]|jgi:hypothetical protein|uniref:hypothetical protein n=1 Tax=Polynucleobacter sp. AP-Latsch-80-C2 TaxID=2576931 RepID=UPI001C0E5195|nr:hypothetical protein [Polynucleobacter sp. AP-Latsch-80-C2]MBU3623216.1 hypothetical protein [Polynucleobacter sp. AP-Latsch-80-C2]
MRRSLFLLSLWALLISGCTFLPQPPDVEKITGPKVENPFFKIPPENLKDYQDRSWILLAESSTKNWFYDPYTLTEDEDGVITFDAFISPREKNRLDRFNPTIVGPYRQKMDCLGNHQWSEIFYAQNIPPAVAMSQANDPTKEYGWIKIRPKTAMAYIRSKICGRKFIDEKNINYFLYQDGQVKTEKEKSTDPIIQASDSLSSAAPNFPTFFEVINNEVLVVDSKKDVREIKISSYVLDKDFPKKGDFTFTANCQSNTYSVQVQGKGSSIRGTVEGKESLAAVAFNRACGNHGTYMKAISRASR